MLQTALIPRSLTLMTVLILSARRLLRIFNITRPPTERSQKPFPEASTRRTISLRREKEENDNNVSADAIQGPKEAPSSSSTSIRAYSEVPATFQ